MVRFLKIGRIISSVGDELIASMHLEKKPLDLKAAKSYYNKPVFLEDSRNAKPIGRIKNVIGRTDEPLLVISQGRDKKPSANLVNKNIYSQVTLKTK